MRNVLHFMLMALVIWGVTGCAAIGERVGVNAAKEPAGVRPMISLDGLWRCAPDPYGNGRTLGYDKAEFDDSAWRDAPVPGAFQDLGPIYIGWKARSWYRKQVMIPTDWSGKRIKLAGEGLFDRATIWIDGKQAGVVDLPYLPWAVDVPAAAGAKIQISVEIDNRPVMDRAPGQIIGWRPLSGLLRPVRLQAESWTTVDLAALSTAGDGRFAAEFKIKRHGERAPAADRVRWRVETLRGKTLDSGEAEAVKGTAKCASRLAGARAWSPESPVLHRLVVELMGEDGTVIDRLERRFGFRRIAVENGKLCLDGRPLQLTGANMHEDRPEAPFRWHPSVRTDLKNMIKHGANTVRLCHYPQDPRILDECDELGLLALTEVPLWGSNAAGKGHAKRVAHARAQLVTMIQRDLHHPSVIFWSVSNETNDGREDAIKANRVLVKLARRLDPSRPVSHVSHTWDKTPNFSEDDLICVNGYPTWIGAMSARDRKTYGDGAEWWRTNLAKLAATYPGKPIVVTEFGYPALGGGAAGQIDEVTQAATIAHEAQGFVHPAICGTLIWCWADHLWPVGGDMALSPFGLLTRDRKPKPALAEAEKVWRQRRAGERPAR